MGLPGKWIKALVGSKKSEKSQSSEKDENVSALFGLPFLFFSFFFSDVQTLFTSVCYI